MALLNISFRKSDHLFTGLFLLYYALTFWLVSFLKSNPSFEVLRSTKWLFFLIAIVFTSPRFNLSQDYLRKVTRKVLLLFACVYTYLIYKNGIFSRPNLITENNYEVNLLICLFLLSFVQNSRFNKHHFFWYLVTAYIVFISKSRSCLIGFLLMSIYLVIKVSSNRRRIQNTVIVLIFSSISLYFILLLREINLGNIDRIMFLKIFINEMSMHSSTQILFGNLGLQTLSIDACNTLRFYSTLQTNVVFGHCYSVVLHSMILRMIFDFGIVGFLVAYIVLYRALKNVDRLITNSLIILSITNGFSVSGINNVYVTLPFLLAILQGNNLPLENKNSK